jgi:PucR C-terminal helix-turn-helix domain
MGPVGSTAEWSAFIARMASEREAPMAAAARIAQLPSYRDLSVAELVPEITRNFGMSLRGLRERRLPAPDEDVTAYERSGEQRARQGVTLADMIQGWTIGIEVARAGVYRWAPSGEHREAFILEAIEIMTAWTALGMNASAAAHRRFEMQRARQEQNDAADVVRGVLLGGAGDRAIGHLERFGIDPARPHYAVRVRPGDSFEIGHVERWLGTRPSAARPNGMVALIDGDVAGFMADRPASASLPVSAGLAGPVPLPAIADAFRLASRALEVAAAIGRTGLTELGELGLMPSVLADADVSRGVLERYVRPLEHEGRAGTTVLDTIRQYLEHDCQVPETAAVLGVHRNTVRYRISRFEERTGCSLRRTETLAEVWWALRRRGLGG